MLKHYTQNERKYFSYFSICNLAVLNNFITLQVGNVKRTQQCFVNITYLFLL